MCASDGVETIWHKAPHRPLYWHPAFGKRCVRNQRPWRQEMILFFPNGKSERPAGFTNMRPLGGKREKAFFLNHGCWDAAAAVAVPRRGKGSLVAAPMYSQIPPRCSVLGRRAAKYYMCITWLSRDGTWLRQSANFAATFKTYPSEDPLNILNNTTQTGWQ